MLLLLFAGHISMAQQKISCDQWRISSPQKVYLPAFNDIQTVDGKDFDQASLLESVQVRYHDVFDWKELQLDQDSLLHDIKEENSLVQLAGFFSIDRWEKLSLSISSNTIFDVSLNGKKVKTQSRVSQKAVLTDLTVDNGDNFLLIRILAVNDSAYFKAELSATDKESEAIISWHNNPQRKLSIHDVLEGESVSSASLSPSGKYLLLNMSEVLAESGTTQRYSRIYDMEKKATIMMLRNSALYASWLPSSDKLFYKQQKGELADIFVFDVQKGEEFLVAEALNNPGRIVWAENESFFVFSKTLKADKTGDLKRVFTNDDRIPNTRNRTHLYAYNLKTKHVQQLTAGNLSASLHAIKPDGSKILFSISKTDYTGIPFSTQDLFEMDLASMQLDTIWQDKRYGAYCQYSVDGNKLLVSGSPESFGDLGVNVSEGRIPNVSDRQLYLFDLKDKTVEALTRDFDPAIRNAYWAKDGLVYMTVVEKDYVNLYKLDLKKRNFTKIEVPEEVISSIDYASSKALAVFNGSGIDSPHKLYALDLKTGKSNLLLYPKEQQLKAVQFGATEDWNFENESGTTIYGRVYYPLDYNPAKKYPVIVNFYGGTTPTDRTFGGRYPKNIWAANGYIVYVMQPSGATGFGQDFSALHVNGWGAEAIDDIIDGTKQFLAAHPSADAENVGCIGASYGGYTTMMLQTRTDIFKTAISHAGISDITSYWGEGYWGYSYSAGATKGSYPWNRKDIYVENSPLFNADKFQNSILLLHGTVDTNVPVGESLQFYAALKILGKDVEMVLVSGEDHHILDYKKRIEWHNTIMAWFEKELKNQPGKWNMMYPDKKL